MTTRVNVTGNEGAANDPPRTTVAQAASAILDTRREHGTSPAPFRKMFWPRRGPLVQPPEPFGRPSNLLLAAAAGETHSSGGAMVPVSRPGAARAAGAAAIAAAALAAAASFARCFDYCPLRTSTYSQCMLISLRPL